MSFEMATRLDYGCEDSHCFIVSSKLYGNESGWEKILTPTCKMGATFVGLTIENPNDSTGFVSDGDSNMSSLKIRSGFESEVVCSNFVDLSVTRGCNPSKSSKYSSQST